MLTYYLAKVLLTLHTTFLYSICWLLGFDHVPFFFITYLSNLFKHLSNQSYHNLSILLIFFFLLPFFHQNIPFLDINSYYSPSFPYVSFFFKYIYQQ